MEEGAFDGKFITQRSDGGWRIGEEEGDRVRTANLSFELN